MHIDWWTLAFQTVNVLVLIWILARFFFRPIGDIVAKRQAQANKVLAERCARQQADNSRADADKKRAEIDAERDRLIAEALKAAQLEKANLLAQSLDEIVRLRGTAEAAMSPESKCCQASDRRARASELSVEIAQRLLARLPPSAAMSAFLDGLCRELQALSSDAKASLVSAAADHASDVVTAAPLSKDEMEHVRDTLNAALGLELSFRFRVDPALIAGVELRSPNTIVSNSWRADLDRIRKELDGDGTPTGS